MARRFRLENRLGPIRQSPPQGTFGFCSAHFTVQRLHTAFHGAFGLPVQRADQYRFPVIPRVRAHTANVANSQNGQQVQPFDCFYSLCEIAHGARIRDVAFLRHIGHQQVIAHKPFNRVTLVRLQSQTWRDRAGNLCAKH